MFSRIPVAKNSLCFRSAYRNYAKYSIKRSANTPRDARILKGIEQAIQKNVVEEKPMPLSKRIGIFLIPAGIVLFGVVGYNAYNNEETYIPILFQKKVLVKEDNSYGIDLAKLKQLTTTRLIQKVSINSKFQNSIGLPITSQEIDKFDVYLEYKDLKSLGFEINPKGKPYISWVSRAYSINHEKLNEFLEPMGISDTDYQFQVVNNPASSVRDYKIVIEGRLKINGNELFKRTGRDCDLNFKGIIDFDHSQNIRFEKVVLCYRDQDGVMKVESLW